MENELKKLSAYEKELLLKAPVLLSILASSTDHKVDRKEKKEAIELSHLRTFTSPPMLQDFYKEVELGFKTNLEELLLKYEPFDEAKQGLIKLEIKNIYTILQKLDHDFANDLKMSLESYGKHVANVHVKFTDFFDFNNFTTFN